MKNLSLILNALLLVAVVVLFFLHFAKASSNTPSEGSLVKSDLVIAYINSDSVLKNYDYTKVTRDEFESKGKKLEQDLRNRVQGFQNDYEAYQRNVSGLTIGQAKAVEEDLQKKQQNLQLYQQSLSQKLSEDEARINQDLYERVTKFLSRYGKEKGFQVVLKMSVGSDLLYGADALDITKDVTLRLNEEYQTEKSQPAGSKGDSTNSKNSKK